LKIVPKVSDSRVRAEFKRKTCDQSDISDKSSLWLGPYGGFSAISRGPKRFCQTAWLLQDRRVVALTKDTALIQTANGTLSYRRYNKPALGPLGDGLVDFAPGAEANAADEAEVAILDPRAHFGSTA
jgi:hypothetical protein